VQKSILVTSPHRAFAELLRSSLEESGRYQVRLAYTAREALAAAHKGRFDLVVLDSDIEDEPVVSVGQKLMELNPDMLLMVIPPENDPKHLSLVNFTPHSYLERPFYLPDLIARLDRLLGLSKAEETWSVESKETPDPVLAGGIAAWLQDRQRITYDLEMLLRESYFSNALLLQDGRVIGTSVQFDPADANKVSELIERHLDSNSDLVRYIRLEAQGGEYLLFATHLSGMLTLATICDVSLPLSQVRSSTRSLAKELLGTIARRESEPGIAIDLDAAVLERVEVVVSPPAEKITSPDIKSIPPEADEFGNDDDEDLVINLDDLLFDMPSPDPIHIFTKSEWEAEMPESSDIVPEQVPNTQPSTMTDEKQQPDGIPELVLPWEEQGSAIWSDATPVSSSPAVDTQSAYSFEDQSETTTPVFVQISFTCILIPARVDHSLVGDLAKSLSQWLPQTCLGFGWHLENLHIEQNYMLWIVNVTPTVSPGNIVRMVRNRTSEQIFAQYPDLRENHISGDFWAPGYLVISGSQPPTQELVEDFIRQTRRRQGIY
jgi:DNA-binding response OmpR family regulator/REP element-mobilizing transposase RayT